MATSFATDLLKLIFQATAIANIADNAASSPITSLYVSLHTADPTASGDQTTHECAYTSYARVGAARDASPWTVAAGLLTVSSDLNFPLCTGSSETAKYLGIGTGASGAGRLLFSGALSPTIGISSGIEPIVKSGSTVNIL